MPLRAWIAFAATGAAGGFAYRGYWAAAAVAAAVVLVPVVWWVRGQLLATRAAMCGERVPGRHRRNGRPLELRQLVP